MREARARSSDPSTSKAAALAVEQEGQPQYQRAQVGEAVNHLPGCTTYELAEEVGLNRNVVARRMPEIERRAVVLRGGKRRCRVTGRQAQTWWPQGNVEV